MVLANFTEVPTLQEYYAPNWRTLPNIGLDILAFTSVFKLGFFRAIQYLPLK